MSLLNLLFGNSIEESDKETPPITVDLEKMRWRPDSDERLLVAHEGCQILEDNCRSVLSCQFFVCCVTDKRIVLIPNDYKVEKKAISIIGHFLGMNMISNYCMLKTLYQNYLDCPIYFSRDEISNILFNTDVPSGKILCIGDKNLNIIMYLGVQNIEYACDIQMAFERPDFFE